MPTQDYGKFVRSAQTALKVRNPLEKAAQISQALSGQGAPAPTNEPMQQPMPQTPDAGAGAMSPEDAADLGQAQTAAAAKAKAMGSAGGALNAIQSGQLKLSDMSPEQLAQLRELTK